MPIMSYHVEVWGNAYKTTIIFFRVRNKSLSDCIIKMFESKEGNYHLRGLYICETRKVRTSVKYKHVLV